MKEITSLAPGRTCLFGDHQDYLGLPVIACAINRNIKLTAVPNDKQVFNLIMNDIDQVRVIDIHSIFSELVFDKPFDCQILLLQHSNHVYYQEYQNIPQENIRYFFL